MFFEYCFDGNRVKVTGAEANAYTLEAGYAEKKAQEEQQRLDDCYEGLGKA